MELGSRIPDFGFQIADFQGEEPEFGADFLKSGI
jgi:hypothetical protein